MKTQKALLVLATASLLGLSVSCNDRYAEGIEVGRAQGYEEGYDDGYADGDEAGFARAEAYFATADYNAGFNAGQTSGIQIGYNQGYTVGKQDGKAEGYTLGYNTGRSDGVNEGYGTGYDNGYDDGYADGGDGAYTTGYNAGYDDGNADGYDAGVLVSYDAGYDDGLGDGYDLGYDDGFGDGYDIGYDDGFDDGWGLSIGKSKQLKGYANLLSMVHNDLIDYSKIKAPTQTARGLLVNGQLLLSETSVTNKDTLKRAAVVEQYVVVEMAKQVKGKFGLSAERSLKVAKAANHFRKYSSKRALTAEDTNAYSTELLGADMTAIEKAYSQSMKGDITSLNSVLEKAADKNGVSPEKMGEIVTSLFI